MAKIPLGRMIDELKAARDERIEYQRETDAKISQLKTKEMELRTKIIAEMERTGLDKATGADATASIQVNLLPRVTDWPAVYRYIQKNNAFDLLERRVGKLAFKSRLEAGERVPGIDVFEEKDLSLTKAGR